MFCIRMKRKNCVIASKHDVSESSTPAHDVLACDLSRSMQKDPTDYDAFSGALAESTFYKEELSRRGLTPEAYRTSIEQAVKKTSGVGLPKEQAQYEAAMRFAKEVAV